MTLTTGLRHEGVWGARCHLTQLCATLAFAFFFSSSCFSQTTIASDNAGNYSGGWTNGANGGMGFGPWNLSASGGTGGFGGSFVGNPSDAGVTGMNSSSFVLYANPTNSGAIANAERVFSNAIAVGQTLSFQWGINFDSGSNGSKGVVFSAGGNEISSLNLFNGGSAAITIGGSDVGFGYGSAAMTWSFTRTATNSYRVVANDRDGTGTYSNNITLTNANGAIDKIKFYAYQMQAGDSAQPYFNNLLITTTTADVTPPVINLAAGVDKVTWVAKNGLLGISTNDVSASDNSGAAPVITISQSSPDSSQDDFITVSYTATDAAGNFAAVQRFIAVGSGGGNWFYSIFPRTLTTSTLTSATAGGLLWINGLTADAGSSSGIRAWVGVNATSNNPANWSEVAWSPATYAGQAGNDDKYEATISGVGRTPGTYYYATRFQLGTNGGNTNYFYGGIDTNGMGGRWNGTTYGTGILTVEAGRLVTYTVDMSVFRKLGTFNPSNHTLQVRTGLQNSGTYTESALTNSTADLYTGEFPIGGAAGATNYFKFFWGGAGGLEWESAIGDRPLVLSANSVATNAGTNFFNNLAGRRNVSFAVDMSVQKFKGLFNASNHTLQVRTGLDTPGYAERALTNTTGDIYTGTFLVDGADSSTNFFKFYVVGTNGLGWEGTIANREVVLGVSGTNQSVGTNFFDGLAESRKLSLSVDMSEQVAKGNFSPSNTNHAVAVRTSLDSFREPLLMNRMDSTLVYSLDYYLDGPLSAVPTSLEYKFFNSAANAPNFGFEGDQPGGGNRLLLKTNINPTNLSTTTIPLATFVNVGSTFTGWRGSSTATPELLTQYAFGAVSPGTPVSQSNLPSGSVSNNNLVLTYYVRKDAANSNLVTPQTHTNLTDSNGWTNVGITISTLATNTNSSGVEVIKSTATVPIDTTNRKFLRLKISE